MARVTNQSGKPVENAVVFIERSGQPAQSAKSGASAQMSQEDRQFTPKYLAVQVGTTVQFPNNDPFRHQVYSFSPAKKFELPLYGRSDVAKVTFDKEGVVTLGCNIHDNMLAYIYVVGTPYFGLVDNDGKATVAQIPAGNYTVKVWHPGQKVGEVAAQDVTLAASDTANIDLKINLRKVREQRKPGAADEKEY
ncbi:MAG: methylamine utilization protein [Rhizomicrobium sp.]